VNGAASVSFWDGGTRVIASGAHVGDLFGFGVAVHGDLGLISAYGCDSASGVVYLTELATGAELGMLQPNDPGPLKGFGFDVALSDTLIAVGAAADNQLITHGGSAYVFDRATGIQVCKLLPKDPFYDARFGNAIGISNDIVLVGAKFDRSHRGAAYVFDALSGSQLQKLTASDGSTAGDGDWFGEWVAIDGEALIVGAHRNDDGLPWDSDCESGSAYLFKRNPLTGIWTETFKLTDPQGNCGDRLGRSVDICGGKAVVGAEGVDGKGAAFVVDVSTGALLHMLTADNSAAGDGFGFSVGIAANSVIVGAPFHNGGQGAAYRFDLASGEMIQFIAAPAGTASDTNLGVNVAITKNGRRGIVGGWRDDPFGITQAGSAYVFNTIP